MGAKKQIQVVFKVKDTEEWERKISAENDKVSGKYSQIFAIKFAHFSWYV